MIFIFEKERIGGAGHDLAAFVKVNRLCVSISYMQHEFANYTEFKCVIDFKFSYDLIHLFLQLGTLCRHATVNAQQTCQRIYEEVFDHGSDSDWSDGSDANDAEEIARYM